MRICVDGRCVFAFPRHVSVDRAAFFLACTLKQYAGRRIELQGVSRQFYEQAVRKAIQMDSDVAEAVNGISIIGITGR